MMNRRAFLATVGAGIVAAPLVPHAQQAGKVWRVAALTTGPRTSPKFSRFYSAFLEELGGLGYREGRNLVIDWHHSEGVEERRRTEAALIVENMPHAVLAASGSDALAVHDVDKSVPIVVASSGDLVAMGLALSLSRPGRNVTGFEVLAPDLMGKRLQLLKEMMPGLKRVALLHGSSPRQETSQHNDLVFKELETAARTVGVDSTRFVSPTLEDLDRTYAEMKRAGVQAVLVTTTTRVANNAARFAEVALRHRLPDAHGVRIHVEEGSLVSYGPDAEHNYRRAAQYMDRIFKGVAPGDLPIERPTRFELAINLKTAKALGLTVPPSLLARADYVIR